MALYPAKRGNRYKGIFFFKGRNLIHVNFAHIGSDSVPQKLWDTMGVQGSALPPAAERLWAGSLTSLRLQSLHSWRENARPTQSVWELMAECSNVFRTLLSVLMVAGGLWVSHVWPAPHRHLPLQRRTQRLKDFKKGFVSGTPWTGDCTRMPGKGQTDSL